MDKVLFEFESKQDTFLSERWTHYFFRIEVGDDTFNVGGVEAPLDAFSVRARRGTFRVRDGHSTFPL